MMAGDSGSVYPSYAIEMLDMSTNLGKPAWSLQSRFTECCSFRTHPLLNQAALAHAEDMAINNYFDHSSQRRSREPGT